MCKSCKRRHEIRDCVLITILGILFMWMAWTGPKAETIAYPGDDIQSLLLQDDVVLVGTHITSSTLTVPVGRTLSGKLNAKLDCKHTGICVRVESWGSLRRLRVESGTTSYVPGHHGIYALSASFVSIEDTHVRYFGDRGIYIRNSSYIRIQNNEILDSGYAGILLQGTAYSSIVGNIVNRVTNNGTSYGISLTSYDDNLSKYVTVSNNQVYNVPNHDCIDTHGGLGLVITGNTVSGCKRGIDIGMQHSQIGGKPTSFSVISNNVVITYSSKCIRRKWYSYAVPVETKFFGNTCEPYTEVN